MSDAVPISAVVVNHDAGDALLGCVASLRAAGINEVVVVDNASSDGSLERLAASDGDVVIVATGANLGYGSAANRGVARCHGDLVLVCNPDLVVDAAAPRRLERALSSAADIAVCGPLVRSPDGSRYPSARAFPSPLLAVLHALVGSFFPDNPWSRRYRMEDEALEERDADWVSGSCFLARKSAFCAVGGFDERYFMYVEDLDLCWRLAHAGWRTRYVPAASVVHEQGVSSGRHPYRMLVAHHASTWRFAATSTAGPGRLLLPLIGLAVAARLCVALSRRLLESARERR